MRICYIKALRDASTGKRYAGSSVLTGASSGASLSAPVATSETMSQHAKMTQQQGNVESVASDHLPQPQILSSQYPPARFPFREEQHHQQQKLVAGTGASARTQHPSASQLTQLQSMLNSNNNGKNATSSLSDEVKSFLNNLLQPQQHQQPYQQILQQLQHQSHPRLDASSLTSSQIQFVQQQNLTPLQRITQQLEAEQQQQTPQPPQQQQQQSDYKTGSTIQQLIQQQSDRTNDLTGGNTSTSSSASINSMFQNILKQRQSPNNLEQLPVTTAPQHSHTKANDNRFIDNISSTDLLGHMLQRSAEQQFKMQASTNLMLSSSCHDNNSVPQLQNQASKVTSNVVGKRIDQRWTEKQDDGVNLSDKESQLRTASTAVLSTTDQNLVLVDSLLTQQQAKTIRELQQLVRARKRLRHYVNRANDTIRGQNHTTDEQIVRGLARDSSMESVDNDDNEDIFQLWNQLRTSAEPTPFALFDTESSSLNNATAVANDRKDVSEHRSTSSKIPATSLAPHHNKCKSSAKRPPPSSSSESSDSD